MAWTPERENTAVPSAMVTGVVSLVGLAFLLGGLLGVVGCAVALLLDPVDPPSDAPVLHYLPDAAHGADCWAVETSNAVALYCEARP